VSEYPSGSSEDRLMLTELNRDKLLDLLFLHIRNLWRVDGLYFLGIEEQFGTDSATAVDAGVWLSMAAIEAKALRRMFGVSENADVKTIMMLLRKSSWALDQPFKTVVIKDCCATLSVDKCRTQEARLSKGLCEFGCKSVRFGYLKRFAETLNPNVKVSCLVCPPDKHPKELWCKWEFRL
jgi:hypothetical protein